MLSPKSPRKKSVRARQSLPNDTFGSQPYEAFSAIDMFLAPWDCPEAPLSVVPTPSPPVAPSTPSKNRPDSKESTAWQSAASRRKMVGEIKRLRPHISELQLQVARTTDSTRHATLVAQAHAASKTLRELKHSVRSSAAACIQRCWAQSRVRAWQSPQSFFPFGAPDVSSSYNYRVQVAMPPPLNTLTCLRVPLFSHPAPTAATVSGGGASQPRIGLVYNPAPYSCGVCSGPCVCGQWTALRIAGVLNTACVKVREGAGDGNVDECDDKKDQLDDHGDKCNDKRAVDIYSRTHTSVHGRNSEHLPLELSERPIGSGNGRKRTRDSVSVVVDAMRPLRSDPSGQCLGSGCICKKNPNSETQTMAGADADVCTCARHAPRLLQFGTGSACADAVAEYKRKYEPFYSDPHVSSHAATDSMAETVVAPGEPCQCLLRRHACGGHALDEVVAAYEAFLMAAGLGDGSGGTGRSDDVMNDNDDIVASNSSSAGIHTSTGTGLSDGVSSSRLREWAYLVGVNGGKTPSEYIPDYVNSEEDEILSEQGQEHQLASLDVLDEALYAVIEDAGEGDMVKKKWAAWVATEWERVSSWPEYPHCTATVLYTASAEVGVTLGRLYGGVLADVEEGDGEVEVENGTGGDAEMRDESVSMTDERPEEGHDVSHGSGKPTSQTVVHGSDTVIYGPEFNDILESPEQLFRNFATEATNAYHSALRSAPEWFQESMSSITTTTQMLRLEGIISHPLLSDILHSVGTHSGKYFPNPQVPENTSETSSSGKVVSGCLPPSTFFPHKSFHNTMPVLSNVLTSDNITASQLVLGSGRGTAGKSIAKAVGLFVSVVGAMGARAAHTMAKVTAVERMQSGLALPWEAGSKAALEYTKASLKKLIGKRQARMGNQKSGQGEADRHGIIGSPVAIGVTSVGALTGAILMAETEEANHEKELRGKHSGKHSGDAVPKSSRISGTSSSSMSSRMGVDGYGKGEDGLSWSCYDHGGSSLALGASCEEDKQKYRPLYAHYSLVKALLEHGNPKHGVHSGKSHSSKTTDGGVKIPVSGEYLDSEFVRLPFAHVGDEGGVDGNVCDVVVMDDTAYHVLVGAGIDPDVEVEMNEDSARVEGQAEEGALESESGGTRGNSAGNGTGNGDGNGASYTPLAPRSTTATTKHAHSTHSLQAPIPGIWSLVGKILVGVNSETSYFERTVSELVEIAHDWRNGQTRLRILDTSPWIGVLLAEASGYSTQENFAKFGFSGKVDIPEKGIDSRPLYQQTFVPWVEGPLLPGEDSEFSISEEKSEHSGPADSGWEIPDDNDNPEADIYESDLSSFISANSNNKPVSTSTTAATAATARHVSRWGGLGLSGRRDGVWWKSGGVQWAMGSATGMDSSCFALSSSASSPSLSHAFPLLHALARMHSFASECDRWLRDLMLFHNSPLGLPCVTLDDGRKRYRMVHSRSGNADSAVRGMDNGNSANGNGVGFDREGEGDGDNDTVSCWYDDDAIRLICRELGISPNAATDTCSHSPASIQWQTQAQAQRHNVADVVAHADAVAERNASVSARVDVDFDGTCTREQEDAGMGTNDTATTITNSSTMNTNADITGTSIEPYMNTPISCPHCDLVAHALAASVTNSLRLQVETVREYKLAHYSEPSNSGSESLLAGDSMRDTDGDDAVPSSTWLSYIGSINGNGCVVCASRDSGDASQFHTQTHAQTHTRTSSPPSSPRSAAHTHNTHQPSHASSSSHTLQSACGWAGESPCEIAFPNVGRASSSAYQLVAQLAGESDGKSRREKDKEKEREREGRKQASGHEGSARREGREAEDGRKGVRESEGRGGVDASTGAGTGAGGVPQTRAVPASSPATSTSTSTSASAAPSGATVSGAGSGSNAPAGAGAATSTSKTVLPATATSRVNTAPYTLTSLPLPNTPEAAVALPLIKKEKRELQVILNIFEKDFEKQNNRRIKYQADVRPVERQWLRYREVKAMLEVLDVPREHE